LKAAREKQQVINKGKPIRITADFSTEIPKEGMRDVLQAKEENKFQLYPAKFFIIEGQIKIFPRKTLPEGAHDH
jgi:hypothetical protein